MTEVDYFTADMSRPADLALMAPLPPQPKSLRETGLERQLVVELVAKAIFVGGKTHLSVLTTRLRLSINVLREVFDFMVGEQLAEVAWRGESEIDVQYQLTGAGKQRAAVFLERSAYLGPAPVTLEAYRAMVARQSWRAQELRVASDDLAAVLGGAHAGAGMLDTVGAALHSGRSLLLYGPPGSGKSALALQLGKLLHGLVAVPYAVLVGHDIIAVHDPAVHLPPAAHGGHARQALERRSTDIRWVLCQRPVVHVGAEFDAGMLELRHDEGSGCYQAPPHVRANNGMLILDDLGCQRMPAPQLLTRLMQPARLGVDQLALRGGASIGMPFDTVLLLATNLKPSSLFDAALLRRIGYKVQVGPLGEGAYRALFRQQCRVAGIAFDELALHHVLHRLHGASGRPLLASTPRELLDRIADFAGFAGSEAQLTLAALDQAWASLFASCDEPATFLPESIA